MGNASHLRIMNKAAFSAIGLALLAAFGGDAATATPAKPQRIVSLNLCTDQILLDLVPRERIAGLSELVADRMLSGRADAARGIPLVRGHAEEVMALAPDLVIAGALSTPASVDLLRRVGVNVVTAPLAGSFAGIRDVIRIVAEAAGVREAGEAMIARFDARLAAVAAPTEPDPGVTPPSVVVYHLNSLASGPGSLLDEIVRAAGFRNASLGMRLGPAGRLPLETLALEAPDMLVVATEPDAYRTITADNLRHPAFRTLLESRRNVTLPMPLWMCGTPDVAEAVERLAAASGASSGKGLR